ncbi:MAG TPA: ribonuclease PH [Spirochaetota bacterium]|nr:ribonuclease PH [Spirochaetota bacterium]
MSRWNRKYRALDEMREVDVIADFCPAADGSVLFSMGNTRVICAATVSSDVPAHAEGKGKGWITAEYTLLPYSTSPRKPRPGIRPDGRSVEIRRLIARCLRNIVDLSKMQGVAITVDCDVLQADGGTRTAAITGSYIALSRAIRTIMDSGIITENPLVNRVGAISTGFIGEDLLLDLDYREDSMADIDMNIIMDGSNNLVEVQGTGEKRSYTMDELNQMLKVSSKAISRLFDIQKEYE